MRTTAFEVAAEKREYGWVGVAIFLDEAGQAVMMQESVPLESHAVAMGKITAMAKALHAVLSTGRRGA